MDKEQDKPEKKDLAWHQKIKTPERVELVATMLWANFPSMTEEEAKRRVLAEASYMTMRLLNANLGTKDRPKLVKNMTTHSIIKGFAEVVSMGLSFSDNAGHVYFESRGDALICTVSAYGEAQMRISKGLFVGYDDPVIYYECDTFNLSIDENGFEKVEYISGDRVKGMEPKGVFIKLIRSDQTFFYSHFSKEEIEEFKKKTERTNSQGETYYNRAWDTGEVGMWKAKAIKHSFKRQPLY